MQHYKITFFLSILSLTSLFSQEKWIKHSVKKGETISIIAKKYKVTPATIYQLNPDCRRALQAESVLLVPDVSVYSVHQKPESKTAIAELTHQVCPKETLFGIAKQYEITLEELNNANPELAKIGLKTGQKITIPTKLPAKKTAVEAKEDLKTAVLEEKQPEQNKALVPETIPTLVHEVALSETKFGLAKQYGISIADLEKANPIIEKQGLKNGQKIRIPLTAESSKTEALSPILSKTNPEKQQEEKPALNPEIAKPQTPTTLFHEVLAKETKYGIAKKYGISVADLETQNPKIAKNLYVGAKLTILTSNAILENTAATTSPNETATNTELAQKQDSTSNASLSKWTNSEALAEELIRAASDNLGSSYRSGGTSKGGFDCSGLVYSTFSSLDIKLPRSSYEMASVGRKVEASEAQKGDLIFFKTNGRSQINHVGMVVEVLDGEIRFIHSSTQSGVIISSTKERYYEKKFSQINRVLPE